MSLVAPPTAGWREGTMVAPCTGAPKGTLLPLQVWCSIEVFHESDARTIPAMVNTDGITRDIGKRECLRLHYRVTVVIELRDWRAFTYAVRTLEPRPLEPSPPVQLD